MIRKKEIALFSKKVLISCNVESGIWISFCFEISYNYICVYIVRLIQIW